MYVDMYVCCTYLDHVSLYLACTPLQIFKITGFDDDLWGASKSMALNLAMSRRRDVWTLRIITNTYGVSINLLHPLQPG